MTTRGTQHLGVPGDLMLPASPHGMVLLLVLSQMRRSSKRRGMVEIVIIAPLPQILPRIGRCYRSSNMTTISTQCMVQAINQPDLQMAILIRLGHLMELEVDTTLTPTPLLDRTFQTIVRQILVMDITPALILPNIPAMDILLKTLSTNKEVLTEGLMVAMILCPEWEVGFPLKWLWVILIYLLLRT